MLLTEMHLPHSAIRVILDLRNPPPLGLLQATGRNHDVEVRHKVEKAAEGLLYNADDQAYAIASPCPLLDSFCSHGWNAMQYVPVLLENNPEFHRQCEGDSYVGYVRQDGLEILLPCFCRALATARTEPRFAGVEYQFRFKFRRIDLCAEGTGSTVDDLPEGVADMRWSTVVVPVRLRIG